MRTEPSGTLFYAERLGLKFGGLLIIFTVNVVAVYGLYPSLRYNVIDNEIAAILLPGAIVKAPLVNVM